MQRILCAVTITATFICSGFSAYGAGVTDEGSGVDVGDGNALYDIPYDPKNVKEVTFLRPTAKHPYYEIVVPIGDWKDGKGASLTKVVVNGTNSDSFYAFVDGFSHVQSGWITRKSETAPNVVIVTRSVWHDAKPTKIDIEFSVEGASTPVIKNFTATAPATGGAPKGWNRYQSVALHESTGLDRKNEPVEFSLTVRDEDCAELAKELRLFSVNNDSGALTPVAVQTFNEKFFAGRPAGTSNPNYLQHPSKSLEGVFFANVPASGTGVYAFFYDNPKADAAKAPESQLKVTGKSLGAIVENEFYVVDLDDHSGQIASIGIKGRDANPAPKLTNSYSRAAHWNPDSFGENGKWGHTFAWNPPDEVTVTTRGPLMFRITCAGRMPDLTNQVYSSVTYTFYSGVPYIKQSTATEVRDNFNASALRNGELVLDSHLTTHFVWQERAGETKRMKIGHGPNWQDEWGIRVDQDVPWLAMTNEAENYGVAEIVQSSIAFNPHRGEATTHRPAFYLYYHHFWAIPVTYFTRGWMYPFSDYQRGPILPMDKGSTYVEKGAFLPAYLGEGDARYSVWQNASTSLQIPLQQRWGR
jgi:hypothetical protein